MLVSAPSGSTPLATWRRARGHTLRTLAAATRIHYVKLHHAEHGRALTDKELTRVARVLGVDVAVLQDVEAAR
jgi:hypothetical protein